MLAALLAVALGAAEPAAAQERGEGPASLFLFYTCSPEKRVAFRRHMEGAGIARFENWKKQGLFGDYLVLFSTYVNPNWDMLVRIDFDRYADSDKWSLIERTTPAGLSPEGLALCSPTDSQLADRMWAKASASRDLSKVRYLVVPFLWANGKARYLTYFEARPKYDLDGWVTDGGVLSAYDVYLNQHHTGARWQALWLLEYRDTASLARREFAKQSVRQEKMEDNPAFKFMRQTGNESRSKDPTVVAAPILPRRGLNSP